VLEVALYAAAFAYMGTKAAAAAPTATPGDPVQRRGTKTSTSTSGREADATGTVFVAWRGDPARSKTAQSNTAGAAAAVAEASMEGNSGGHAWPSYWALMSKRIKNNFLLHRNRGHTQ
jgi:hypothetical protein